ncbi:MAG: hypothetical protein KF721_07100 [Ignavibacteriaceae bacterium]|nr:hypothetical protein [Ignavibacteriaceae bacterium]
MRIIFFITLNIFTINLLAQFKANDYVIFEANSFSKISTSESQASNSINDIVISGNTVWLGTSRGVSRTTNNGLTWENYYGTPQFGTEAISSLHYDNYNNIIWSTTAHSVKRDGQNLPEGSGIRFSTDNGYNWIVAPQPLDDEGDSIQVYGHNFIRALPVTVAIQNISYDLVTTKNYVWIASFAGGLRRANIDSLKINPNMRWERIILPPDRLNSISPTDTLDFSLQPVVGKFGKESNLNHRVFSLIAADDTTLFVGTANGINKTTNALATKENISWIKYNHQNQFNGVSGNFVVALDFNQNENTLWAATWKAEDLNEDYGISYSSDRGVTWKTALINEKAHNFGLFGKKVIAATDNGAYRSADAGNSWILPGLIKDITTNLQLRTSVFYSAQFTNNSEFIWLGTTDGLVRVSGINDYWNDDWKLFLASQKLSSKNESYAYPNPFSPKSEAVKIKYSTGAQSASVTIRIFDFNMNYIRTIIQNADRGFSNNQINSSSADGFNGVIDVWDGKDQNGTTVPNGVYFYRIDISNAESLYGKIMVLQ